MLHEFLTSNREELISRCRAKVAERNAPRPTEKELEFGIPVFLTQLSNILRSESLNSQSESAGPAFGGENDLPADNGMGKTASNHGGELLGIGLTVDQVVHDYGDLCQAVTELAIERNASIKNDEFHTLNRCLDNAIADAVSQYTHERDRVNADVNEHTMNERLGLVAHEFRNRLNTAVLAWNVIKTGHVGLIRIDWGRPRT